MNQPPGQGQPPGYPYAAQPGQPAQAQPGGYQHPQAQQAAYPQQGYPQQQGYPAQPGYPQQGYPQQAQQPQAQPQQQGYPQQAYPQQAYPQQAYPQQAYQQPGAPAQQQAYGAQPQQAYGAPGQQPGYGAPAQQPGYGAPGQQPGYGAPGQQPGFGAPAQDQQQGMQAPKMDFSIGARGGVMLHYEGGAFSKEALLAAVVEGKGFPKPRLMGAALFGLAVVFSAGNFALVMIANRFYPYLYSLAAVFGWAALWLLITGQPAMQPDGSKAPMWGRVGLGVCLAVGLLAGIAMAVMPWERMLVGG